MRLGVATCAKCPELTASERPLLSLLKHYRIDASPVVWNDPAVDWASYDALLVRSIWDYHLHYEDYLSWLNLIDQLGIVVWNSTQVLRWNSHKFYLRDLAQRGVDIVPTLFLQEGTVSGRDEALAMGWSEVVAKPAVSASGYRTHALSLQNPKADAVLADISAHGDFLIQPFQPAIRETGEVSLVFFENEYSHAVLKRPRNDDFRVQAEHGGNETAYEPDQSIILSAREILRKTRMQSLYARVDGIAEAERLVLMELELIEPDLFLTKRPGSEKVFASRIAGLFRPSASS
jgi:glutathione synthase/RimK-type ligase-like ATP-grasp enzyme